MSSGHVSSQATAHTDLSGIEGYSEALVSNVEKYCHRIRYPQSDLCRSKPRSQLRALHQRAMLQMWPPSQLAERTFLSCPANEVVRI